MKHGLTGYNRGCRCDICRLRRSDWDKTRRAQRLAAGLPEGDPRHGTHGYNAYGCRCDICREAGRAYRLRIAKNRTPMPEHHGTLTGYNYGCRCPRCAAAYRQYRTRYVPARAEAVAFGAAEVGAHGAGGYNYGCRCETCVTGRQAARMLRLLRRLPARQRARACQDAIADAPHRSDLRAGLYRLRDETLWALTRQSTYRQVAEMTGLTEMTVTTAVLQHLRRARRHGSGS